MANLKDKYAKYNFNEGPDDEEDSIDNKEEVKEELSEEELEALRKKRAEELAEKKKRIIEGTNFDNSLRK